MSYGVKNTKLSYAIHTDLDLFYAKNVRDVTYSLHHLRKYTYVKHVWNFYKIRILTDV